MPYTVTIVFEISTMNPETYKFDSLIETVGFIEGYLETIEECNMQDRIHQIEISPSI